MEESICTFDVSTPAGAAQARLKVSALVIGGYDILAIEEQDVINQETGQKRRIRIVHISGDKPIVNLEESTGAADPPPARK